MTGFPRASKVTVTSLRRDHPAWDWTPEQRGFGSWVYHGKLGDRTVLVQAFALTGGDDRDEYLGARWYVKEGQVTVSLFVWEMT